MPFIVIKGTFHLVGATKTGKPTGFQPDGDSMHFKPANPKLLDRLRRLSRPYRLTAIGSTQLRFEGIDALELHFEGTHQPRPLADDARDHLTGELGLNPVPYAPPENITVKPPVPRDAVAGCILSRALEINGRPVAFAFEGDSPEPDGRDVFLDSALLKKSLNHELVAAGQAYPLFYDTLFADLREVLATASAKARKKGLGLWGGDRTQKGLAFPDQAALEEKAVVFPKLFRRLTEYLRTEGSSADGFLPWLAATEEQVLDLTTGGFTHFDDVLTVTDGRKVKLTRLPEQIVFVSAKSASPAVAPWVRI